MGDFVEDAKRVLVISTGGYSALPLARGLPADGLLILMDADPARGAEARQSFADAGLADRASVIIGDPARILYKIAGPFDLIVYDGDVSEHDSLRGTLSRRLAPGGRLITLITNDDKN